MDTVSSLNDLLYRDSKLHKNIINIIKSFRFQPVVFTADIRQIWQIMVDSADQEFLRYITNSKPSRTFVLHGFCDSSEKAYLAVIYIVSNQNHSSPSLLTAKTRVAPLKKITIPRLELCSALMIQKLSIHYSHHSTSISNQSI